MLVTMEEYGLVGGILPVNRFKFHKRKAAMSIRPSPTNLVKLVFKTKQKIRIKLRFHFYFGSTEFRSMESTHSEWFWESPELLLTERQVLEYSDTKTTALTT